MKDIKTAQSKNDVIIRGKVISKKFRSGTTKTGVPYESADIKVRVSQTYCGQNEISEIPVSFFASQYTKTGAINPAFKTIQELKDLKTLADDGSAANSIAISGTSLSENSFVSRSGVLTNSWRIQASFISPTTRPDCASFAEEIFIIDKKMEMKDDEETGRLILKGGVVQYNGKLDVIEFIAEAPSVVDFIDRNWEIHDTVLIKGRIRYTSVEEKTSGVKSSFGVDEVEESSGPQAVRELIITDGQDEPFEEDFAYDPADIKKAFNVRKANLEQMQIQATSKTSTKSSADSKYNWE